MLPSQWAHLSARELKQRYLQLRAARIAACRKDPNTFIEHVLKDEKTSQPVRQTEFHREWQALATMHSRLVIHSHREAAKTQQISIGRVLWEIGRNPDIRIGIISNTDEQAKKIVRSIKQYIEESAEYHEVFPHVRPDKRRPWNEHALTVVRRSRAKDPTVQAKSVRSRGILGGRLDLVVLDDYQSYDSTATQAARDDMFDRYNAVILGTLDANGRVVIVETPWHPDDPTHRFLKNPLWRLARYPVVYDPDLRKGDPEEKRGQPRWPERWPVARIKERRQELELQSPFEYQRQMLCIARDQAAMRFKPEWIRRSLEVGEGKSVTHALARLPNGFRTYTGVDLAVQQHAAADLTVFFTIAVRPDGKREVLCVESGRWHGPEIVQRLVYHQFRFQSHIILENNGGQDFIRHFANDKKALPITTFTTGKGRASLDFWAEKMAAEMSQGHWVIPNREGKVHPELGAWLNEVRFWDPRNHTGDRMAASLFAMFGAVNGVNVPVIRPRRVVTMRR